MEVKLDFEKALALPALLNTEADDTCDLDVIAIRKKPLISNPAEK